MLGPAVPRREMTYWRYRGGRHPDWERVDLHRHPSVGATCRAAGPPGYAARS
jgi:hypothetical protein